MRVLEASIETLKAENEILKRRLAAAETRAAQAVITQRLDTLAADIGNAGASRARAAPVVAPLLVRLAGWLTDGRVLARDYTRPCEGMSWN